MLKKLLYKYQKFFWYVSVAKTELLKPLGFWNETLLLLTFFAVMGIRLGIMDIIIMYIGVLMVSAILGIVFVKLGIVSLITSFGNGENPELKSIKEKVDEILKK